LFLCQQWQKVEHDFQPLQRRLISESSVYKKSSFHVLSHLYRKDIYANLLSITSVSDESLLPHNYSIRSSFPNHSLSLFCTDSLIQLVIIGCKIKWTWLQFQFCEPSVQKPRL
jgi:hypothetical protein